MPRTARPWYSAEKKCFMAHVLGKKVRLVKGDNTSANRKLAAQKLKQIVKSTAGDPTPGLTVAEVIEQYLKLNQSRYCKESFQGRLTALAKRVPGESIIRFKL
jgi:hypothetical protein